MAKRILICFLIFVLLFSGCGYSPIEEAVESNLGTSIDLQEINTQTDIHIRDKELLYSLYDNTEIVTMYLTVSSGNAAEGTNHTWEEINTYSAFCVF